MDNSEDSEMKEQGNRKRKKFSDSTNATQASKEEETKFEVQEEEDKDMEEVSSPTPTSTSSSSSSSSSSTHPDREVEETFSHRPEFIEQVLALVHTLPEFLGITGLLGVLNIREKKLYLQRFLQRRLNQLRFGRRRGLQAGPGRGLGGLGGGLAELMGGRGVGGLLASQLGLTGRAGRDPASIGNFLNTLLSDVRVQFSVDGRPPQPLSENSELRNHIMESLMQRGGGPGLAQMMGNHGGPVLPPRFVSRGSRRMEPLVRIFDSPREGEEAEEVEEDDVDDFTPSSESDENAEYNGELIGSLFGDLPEIGDEDEAKAASSSSSPIVDPSANDPSSPNNNSNNNPITADHLSPNAAPEVKERETKDDKKHTPVYDWTRETRETFPLEEVDTKFLAQDLLELLLTEAGLVFAQSFDAFKRVGGNTLGKYKNPMPCLQLLKALQRHLLLQALSTDPEALPVLCKYLEKVLSQCSKILTSVTEW